MKTTLKQKAAKANGLDRMCASCPYPFTWKPAVCQICNDAFKRGYVKGYKQRQKEESK